MEKKLEMDRDFIGKNRIKGFLAKINLSGMYFLGVAFCAFLVVLVLVEANVRYTLRPESLDLLPKDELAAIKSQADKTISNEDNQAYVRALSSDAGNRVLLVLEEDDPMSAKARELWVPVLDQIKADFDICDATDFECGMLDKYSKVIMAVTKYTKLSEEIIGVRTWVKNGGNLMIAFPPETTGSYTSFNDLLGVADSGDAVLVEGIRFDDNFMIGASSHDYPIIDAYESALAYSLTSDCEVLMESTDEYPVPLIWRRGAGKGVVVVDNFGIIDKAYRGIHCAAFSLLGEYCVYPVINGAAFYIDDFPSPIPEGNSEYITRDYHMSVSDFYSQVWWNDIYDLGKKHDIHYTGLIIEDYSNQVEGEFKRNKEVARFQYFGNMMLKAGGEIGIHGYNHMPLVLENFDYKDQYDAYIQWPDQAEMKKSIDEVFDFTKELFPEEELQVYVPPSNVLSEEGRSLLSDTSIRCIAAVYLPVDMSFEQEFDISEDGMINTPRITSGCVIDEYMDIAALSELNFHLVNTHFHHPDDVLDEDRGAALGWKKLYANLEKYMDWLYTSFPDIRNLTGSELAAAVQRYDLLEMVDSCADDRISITLGNFNKEAWLMLRVNEGKEIAGITGADYRKMTDDLYLLECSSENIEVELR